MEWIPTSEQLPDINVEVLATTSWGDVTIAWRTRDDDWLIHEGEGNATDDDVVAWMKLPEPFPV